MLSNDEHGMIEKSLGDNPLAEKTEKTSLSNSVTGQPATSNSVSGVSRWQLRILLHMEMTYII